MGGGGGALGSFKVDVWGCDGTYSCWMGAGAAG